MFNKILFGALPDEGSGANGPAISGGTTKQDIINYVMHSPYNTNEAVLRSLLGDLSEGGGDDIIVVHATYDDTDDKWTYDVPYETLVEGFYVNKKIILLLTDDFYGILKPMDK